MRDTKLKLKAYTVSFTNVKGPGRRHSGTYQSAVVIADNVMAAGELANEYQKAHFPKLFVEEIRIENDLVIMK